MACHRDTPVFTHFSPSDQRRVLGNSNTKMTQGGCVFYGDRVKGASCSLGVGGPRFWVARFFKCSKILLITLGWVMKENMHERPC